MFPSFRKIIGDNILMTIDINQVRNVKNKSNVTFSINFGGIFKNPRVLDENKCLTLGRNSILF